MNTARFEISRSWRLDGRTFRRLGSAALLATVVFIGGCGPTKAPAPQPAKRQVVAHISCGDLPVVGVYYHAYQKDDSAPGGFASWSPEKGNPNSAVATASVPIGSVALGFDVGCGGTPKHWAINSHQDAQNLAVFNMFGISCDFTPADLPESGIGTKNVANACTVTPQIPATAGNR